MSIEQQLHRINELYTSNIREHGRSSRAVGWNSESSQLLRFSKLAALLQGHVGPVTVNDYGCGYGALLQFLVDELQCDVAEYHGYDISSEMLQHARQSLAPFGSIVQLHASAEVRTHADYSFVSGTFNVRFDAAVDEWRGYVERRLEELDTHSRRGFAFNLLTAHVDWEEPHLYYADPCYWFELCRRRFSGKVALLHDYPLWEWTIVVRK